MSVSCNSHQGRPAIRSLMLLAGLIAVLLGLASAAARPAQASDLSPYIVDGAVNAITHSGGNTYVGGSFTHVGRRSGGGVPVGASSGLPAGFPEVSGGPVYTVIGDGHGGWYVGGSFQFVGGQAHAGLAHVNSGGTVDSGFAPTFDDAVRALALSTNAPDSGTLYVGGSFTKINGSPHRHLAALSTAGAPQSDFSPDPDADVNTLALMPVAIDVTSVTNHVTSAPSQQPMSILFAGGSFTQIGANNSSSNHEYALGAVWGRGATASSCATGDTDGDSGSAESAETATLGADADDSCTPASQSGNTVPWAPLSVGPVVRSIVLGQSKSVASVSGSCPSAAATATCKLDVPVYFGGTSTTTNGLLAAYQFEITTSDGTTSPQPGAVSSPSPYSGFPASGTTFGDAGDGSPAINSLALGAAADDNAQPPLYVGGDYALGTTPSSQKMLVAITGFARNNADSTSNSSSPPAGTLLSTWAPNPDAPVNAVTVSPGGDVYVGGTFASIAGSGHRFTAALSPTSVGGTGGPAAAARSWDPQLAGGGVNALAFTGDGSTAYLGGSFDAIGALSRVNLAAFDSTGNVLVGWAPSVNGAVHALAASGSQIFAGGDFTQVGTDATGHLVSFDSTSGGRATGFTPSVDGSVLALSVTGSSLYLGGAFQNAGGQARSNIAAVDPGNGTAQAFNPSADDYVNALDASCSNVYAGGSFTQIGGQARDRIAALDPTSGSATAWDPGSNSTIYALARAGNLVYAGGSFGLIGTQAHPYLAAVDADTGKATDWNPVPSYTVYAVALDGQTLYAGGLFRSLDDDNTVLGLAGVDVAGGTSNPDGSTRPYLMGFNPPATGPDGDVGAVRALSISGNRLDVGGEFTNLGQLTQQGFGSFTAAENLASVTQTCAAPAKKQDTSTTTKTSTGTSTTATPPALSLTGVTMTPSRFRVSSGPTAMAAAVKGGSKTTKGPVKHKPTKGKPVKHKPTKGRPIHRASVPRGTVFHFVLSRPAQITIAFYRVNPLRNSRGRCPVRTKRRVKHPKTAPCPAFIEVGQITRNGVTGNNAVSFSGRIGTTPLALGAHRAVVTATVSKTLQIAAPALSFQIVR